MKDALVWEEVRMTLRRCFSAVENNDLKEGKNNYFIFFFGKL